MSGTKLTIGSFNLRGPYDQPPNDWAHRLPRMLKTLAKLKFDIFGAQETVPEYIRDLTAQTAYQSIGHGRESDHGGEATPIFYRPDRLQVLSDETFWLTETPEVFSRSWGTTCTRIGTIGLFEDKGNGTKFLFANLHLQHKEMYECQKNQLNVMLSRLREHYDRTLPVILTGDFNCAPDDPAAKLAASVFADARRCAKKVSGTKYNTYHGFSRENVDNPEKRPIDYIFVSPGVRVGSFDTVDNFDADGLASSDHFPVRAVVTLPAPRKTARTKTVRKKKTDIGKLDRNLTAETAALTDMDVYKPDDDPIQLTGLPWHPKGGAFCRLPEEMDLSFSPGVQKLNRCTAGAAMRFRSDTAEVRLHAQVDGCRMCHMSLIGSMGFDLYAGNGLTQVFAKSTRFGYDENEYTCTVFVSPNRIMRDFTIYFPLYSGVKTVEIGLVPGARIEAPTPWRDPRPVVFYGTSITQGGCVSRPGMLYSNILSRLLGQPFYNFGFSGNGRGEPQIAEQLAEIADPAMYVLDYDDNARPERLEKTLRPFIRILRRRHPEVPILALSTEPKSAEAFEPFDSDYASKERPLYERIHRTVFEELRAAGDDNIYCLDGRMLYGADFDECTVDGAHATDLGSYRVAHALAPVIDRILRRWW